MNEPLRKRYHVGIAAVFAFALPAYAADTYKLNVAFGDTTEVGSLSEYIGRFYQFFVGAIGIIAVAMIMYGGYKWIVAGGKSETVQSAKDTITAAIIGVVIALVSYIILNLINPQLTQLTEPNLAIDIDYTDDYFCSDIQFLSDYDPECGKPTTIPKTNKVCFGDQCPAGQDCVRVAGKEIPECLDIYYACEAQEAGTCDVYDQQLVANGMTDIACREVTFYDAPYCFIVEVLGCPDHFIRADCNVGNGADTPCWLHGAPSVCYINFHMQQSVFPTCRDASVTRAAEHADAVCCQADDTADYGQSKPFVSCNLEPEKDNNLALQVKVDCAGYDAVPSIAYKNGVSSPCIQSCWADVQLVVRPNGSKCTEPKSK